MKHNIFDKPPEGFDRSNTRGWLQITQSPQRKTLNKLKSENADLKSRLEQLEAAVAEMASGKKKK